MNDTAHEPLDVLNFTDCQEYGTPAQVAALYASLAKATAAFGPIGKDREVFIKSEKGSYKFEYAPLEVLFAATKPALSANGLAVLMPFGRRGEECVQRLILAHAEGARVVFSTWFSGDVRDIKQFGGLTTYMQRYLYRSVFALAADADLDDIPSGQHEGGSANAGPRREPSPAPKAPAQAAQKPAQAAPRQDAPKPAQEQKPAQKHASVPPPAQEKPAQDEIPFGAPAEPAKEPPKAEPAPTRVEYDQSVLEGLATRAKGIAKQLGYQREEWVERVLEVTGKGLQALEHDDLGKLIDELSRENAGVTSWLKDKRAQKAGK